jgi:hypothetical protein
VRSSDVLGTQAGKSAPNEHRGAARLSNPLSFLIARVDCIDRALFDLAIGSKLRGREISSADTHPSVNQGATLNV